MSFCPRCDETPEDINLFRGCSESQNIWSILRGSHWCRLRLNKPILEWILVNSKAKYSFHLDKNRSWSTVFVVTLWQIWENHNLNCFQNIVSTPTVSTKTVLNYAKDITIACQPHTTSGDPFGCLIFRCPHSLGCVKLNTDGCFYESNNKAGIGGIFRDPLYHV